MTRIFRSAAVFAVSAVLSLAAMASEGHSSHGHGHHGHHHAAKSATLQGTYMEARTADVFIGQCFRNSEVGLVGDLGVMGWHIDKGGFEGVDLSGLSVIAVVRANGTIGDVHTDYYPAKAVLIVDEAANATQRLALQRLAGQLGGRLVEEVVAVNVEPISMGFLNGDVHSRVGTLKAGDLVDLQTRAIQSTDKHCSHEETVYDPMTSSLDHAMPAFTVAHRFAGKGLGSTWSSPYKMSAFVGTFHLNEGGELLVSQHE
jgi:hypothetical protein